MRKLDEFTKKILHPEQVVSSQVQGGNEDSVNTERMNVYFLDIDALIHYSGPLYGSFLVEKFVSSYIVPGDDNVYVTDEATLERLRLLEDAGESDIYSGYSAFIERNMVVIPKKMSIDCFRYENAYRKWIHGTVIAFENEACATVFGSLLYLYKKAGFEPVLVTYEDEMARVARELGFSVINK